MEDHKAEGLSKLKDMLLGRRSSRLSALGKEPEGKAVQVHVLKLHPEDGSVEGDLEAEGKLDDTAEDGGPETSVTGEGETVDEAEHPLMKQVMRQLNRVVPKRK